MELIDVEISGAQLTLETSIFKGYLIEYYVITDPDGARYTPIVPWPDLGKTFS